MGEIDLINGFVKMFIINFLIYLICEKVINYKNTKFNYIFMFFLSAIMALLHIIIDLFLPAVVSILIIYSIYGISVKKIIKDKFNFLTYIYSCIISYIIYVVSTILAGVLLWFIGQRIDSRSPIILIIIYSIIFLVYCAILKVKRFKKGLNFLKNTNINKTIIISTVFLTSIVISLYVFFQNENDFGFNIFLIMESIIIAVLLLIWIKSQITKTYKNRMRDRTIEMQKAEIDEQVRIMDDLKTENLKLASAIHKYNKKFSALEFAMKNAVESGANTEFANEISVILEETKDASKNFAKETGININKLPLTNNVGIDNMFKYMQEEARKKDINFDLKLNTSINPLLENIIKKDKFETLIGDHLKDAIIAVDASVNSYKSILATLGVVDGIYEFSVYDTGIEFEIDTLLKLGKEQITTHKEEGGSGIGFMTTFETLKECKASLIIEEYNPETTNYTKAVVIRFDGKNQYKIYSYRAEEIKKQNKGRKIYIKQLR